MRTNACSSIFNTLSVWQRLHKRFSLWTLLDSGMYPDVSIFSCIWTRVISCTIRCIAKQVTGCPMGEVVLTRVRVAVMIPFNSRNEKSYKDIAWNFHLYLLAHFYQLQTYNKKLFLSHNVLLIAHSFPVDDNIISLWSIFMSDMIKRFQESKKKK